MILLLDNFDSFTYNLVDYFGQLGVHCQVLRNNLPLSEIVNQDYEAVVLSPGPESPHRAGVLMEVLDYYVDKLPVLGICLGHQAIGIYFGANLVRAQKPMHGKISRIYQTNHALFNGLPPRFNVVRYHSLILENTTKDLVATAFTEREEIMAISHIKYPIHGIQYHPEAALTEHGLALLRNWLKMYQIGPYSRKNT